MLETQVKQMLEQTRDIQIVKKQGPSIYIGKTSYDMGGAIFSSTPLHRDKERELWKLEKSEVHNYLATFNLGVLIQFIDQLLTLEPVMQKVISDFVEKYNPLDVEPFQIITSGGKEDYALHCGRAIFMEKIGEEKTTTTISVDEGQESEIFKPNTNTKTNELYRVVKVTFCPTDSIATFVAEKYNATEIHGIFVDLPALRRLGFYEQNQKRSFLDRVLGR